MKTIEKYTGLVLCMALLFSCCLYSNHLTDETVTAKTIWVVLISGVALIYFGVTTHFISYNLLDIVVVVFMFYLLVNPSNNNFPHLSISGLEDITLLISYFLTKRVVAKDPWGLPLLAAILLLTFVQTLTAFLQWFEILTSFNSNFRFSGFFFNPTPFVILLTTLLIFAVATCLFTKNNFLKLAAFSLLLLSLPIIAIALSRSVYCGLFAGTVLIICVRFPPASRINTTPKPLYASLLKGLLIVITIAITGYFLYFLKKDSADGRLLVWKVSFRIFTDHMVNGIGNAHFPSAYLQYQAAYFKQNPSQIASQGRLADTVAYAFNDLLQISVEQGLIGLTLLTVILVVATQFSRSLLQHLSKVTKEYDKIVLVGACGSLVVIVVSGLFSYPFVMLPIKIVFFFSLAIISGYQSTNFRSSIKYKMVWLKGIGRLTYYITITLAGIAMIYFSFAIYDAYSIDYHIGKEGYKTDMMTKLARYDFLLRTEPWYILRKCDYLLSMNQFDRAIAELEAAKKTASNKVVYIKLGQLYAYQKKYDQAEAQYRLVYYALPSLLQPKYLLAKLYYESHQTAKWKKAATEVLAFKPKVTSWMTDTMISDIRRLKLAESRP